MKKVILLSTLIVIIGSISAQVPDNLSDEDKIYGLSKIWKEADKNFVFFDQVPSLDWDETYQAFIPKVLKTESTYDYYKILQEFCSLLQDGHTKVYVPWDLSDYKEVAPPIKTELIEGKVIVTEILNDTIKNEGLKAGMEIVAIDGIDVHEYAEKKIKPYVFYSTKQDMNVQVYEYSLLKGEIEEKVALKTANNKTYLISRKLSRSESDSPIFEFQKLDDGIGYLKIRRFYGDDFQAQFDTIFKDVLRMPKLVIDVSENLGGSSGYSNYVLSHFVDKPFETSRWKTLMYMPAWVSSGFNTQWQDNEGNIVEPIEEGKRYTKPLVVLISEKTYSAGEDFVSAFLNTERGIVIGRPTAGTTGNPMGFSLPGEGAFQVCTKRDYLSNGEEFVGYGIEPQRIVEKKLDKNHLLNEAMKLLE